MSKLGGFELLEQNSSKGNIRTFSIKIRYQWTPIDVSLEFHADLPRYREKNNFVVPVTKTPTFSPPFCAPLAKGAKISTREF